MQNSTGGHRAEYNFKTDYGWSQSPQQQEHETYVLANAAETRTWAGGDVSVTSSTRAEDISGFDYRLTASDGRVARVDVKARRRGAFVYWKNGIPEIALETWSTMPDPERGLIHGSVGWACDATKTADLIAFVFHPDDCPDVYIYRADMLRETFARHRAELMRDYRVKAQRTGTGRASECVFVPVDVWQRLYDAVTASYGLRGVWL